MTSIPSTGDAGDRHPTVRLEGRARGTRTDAKRPPEVPTDPSDPAYADQIESWMDSLVGENSEAADATAIAPADSPDASPPAAIIPPATALQIPAPVHPRRPWMLAAIALAGVTLVGIAVQGGFLRRSGPAVGRVVASTTILRASADGVLVALPLAEGDEVAEGAIVARIDPAVEERSFAAARSRLADAQASAERARQDLAAAERDATAEQATVARALDAADVRCREALLRFGHIARLHEQKQSSDATFEFTRDLVQKEKAARTQAQAAVEALPAKQKAALETLRDAIRESDARVEADARAVDLGLARLAATAVKAPIAGVVGSHRAAIGSRVSSAEGGTPLLTLLDRAHPLVEATLDPEIAATLAIGSPASVESDAAPGSPIRATIQSIDPSGDVRLELAPQASPPQLVIGMRVRVTFAAQAVGAGAAGR